MPRLPLGTLRDRRIRFVEVCIDGRIARIGGDLSAVGAVVERRVLKGGRADVDINRLHLVPAHT